MSHVKPLNYESVTRQLHALVAHLSAVTNHHFVPLVVTVLAQFVLTFLAFENAKTSDQEDRKETNQHRGRLEAETR